MCLLSNLVIFPSMITLFVIPSVIQASQGPLDVDLGLEAFSDLARAFSDIAGHADKCTFTCPGSEKPKARPDFKPTSNGCGSYGIQIEVDMVPGMSKCCDEHDICYDTCGSKRQRCDKTFRECLEKLCRNMKASQKEISACKASSNILYSGAVTLGCDAYLTSQKNACVCSTDKSNKKSRNEL